jgi:hypothetical protein
LISNKSVIYLITSPLTKRDYDRFGIQRWLDRGWAVKVYDFTKFLKLEFWEHVNGQHLSVDFDGLKIIEDETSALILIESLEGSSVFIDLLGSSRAEQKLRQSLHYKGKTLKLKLGSFPSYRSDGSNLFRKVQKALNHPSVIFITIFDRIRRYCENSPNYLVVGGTLSNPTVRENSVLIKAHNLDYDSILTDQIPEDEIDNGGIVFLDGDEAYHSDYVHLGIDPYVTAENYYPFMDVGLSRIAESLGYDVKVAAHPRSDYDKKSIKYSLPILKDQTFELIKKAGVVVSHASTALQWAVYMRKPIILVTTDEIDKCVLKQFIEAFAFALGKDVVNINKIPKKYDWKSQLFVDETKYQNYIETYVKQPGSPEKPVWEIVIDRMESDLLHK